MKTALWNPISIFLLHILSIPTYVTTSLASTCQRFFQTAACKPRNQCKHQQLCVNFLLSRRYEKCITEGSKCAQWIGLYPSFHLSWVLGPFVQGRLQNLPTTEDTSGHGLTLQTGRMEGQIVRLILNPYLGFDHKGEVPIQQSVYTEEALQHLTVLRWVPGLTVGTLWYVYMAGTQPAVQGWSRGQSHEVLTT